MIPWLQGLNFVCVLIQAKRLKAIMTAAAELAALRLRDPADLKENVGVGPEAEKRDRMFHLLDINGDGRISIEELTEVMKELGATGDDAQELMQLLDANSDGSLSSDEFDSFQRQVKLKVCSKQVLDMEFLFYSRMNVA